jgi:hypothetical protein
MRSLKANAKKIGAFFFAELAPAGADGRAARYKAGKRHWSTAAEWQEVRPDVGAVES